MALTIYITVAVGSKQLSLIGCIRAKSSIDFFTAVTSTTQNNHSTEKRQYRGLSALLKAISTDFSPSQHRDLNHQPFSSWPNVLSQPAATVNHNVKYQYSEAYSVALLIQCRGAATSNTSLTVLNLREHGTGM